MKKKGKINYGKLNRLMRPQELNEQIVFKNNTISENFFRV